MFVAQYHPALLLEHEERMTLYNTKSNGEEEKMDR